jgi:hypothetical protein
MSSSETTIPSVPVEPTQPSVVVVTPAPIDHSKELAFPLEVNIGHTSTIKPPKPPQYDGNRDPAVLDSWLWAMDSYAALTHATNGEIMHFLNINLTGDASAWYHRRYNTDAWIQNTWMMIRAEMKEYFISPNYDRRLRDQWAKCKQVTTVTDYVARLEALATRIPITEDNEFYDKFLRGLKPRTRIEVELKDPKTVKEAIRLADRYDMIVYQNQKNGDWDPWGTNRLSSKKEKVQFQEDTRGEPMILDALVPKKKPNSKKKVSLPAREPNTLQRLSPEERDHLVEIGACFKCRKPGHLAKDCPTRMSKKSKN